MKTRHNANGVAARPVTSAGKRMILVEEKELDRLQQKADEWEPTLPEPDASGNFPALEYARVALALKIIRHRRRLGLTQQELARRAGIRLASLLRLELGASSPNVKHVEQIEQALTNAEQARRRRNGRTRSRQNEPSQS